MTDMEHFKNGIELLTSIPAARFVLKLAQTVIYQSESNILNNYELKFFFEIS